jgi:frataxin-like iron-binding protein CyaY
MKSNFEERRENKIEAYQRLAAKNGELATSSFNHAHKLGDCIPMGQPILVGHHSEKRHRAHLTKMDNAMRKGVEAEKKAKYYEDRAETLLNGTAISSDDPNAIDKLQTKLENLMKAQQLYKAINKIVRTNKSDIEKVAAMVAIGIKDTTATKLLEKGNFGGQGIPSFKLTNNNAVINNTRKRIEQLTKVAQIETSEEEINGVTLKISSEDNRVQIFFPGKPSEEIRHALKASGFHWSPRVGAWMRQISNSAIYRAKEILKG